MSDCRHHPENLTRVVPCLKCEIQCLRAELAKTKSAQCDCDFQNMEPSQVCPIHGELAVRLAEVMRERIALQEDARRLDWLDMLKPDGWTDILFEYQDGRFVGINFCQSDYDDDSEYYTGDTWREVIDAAISARAAETSNEDEEHLQPVE